MGSAHQNTHLHGAAQRCLDKSKPGYLVPGFLITDALKPLTAASRSLSEKQCSKR